MDADALSDTGSNPTLGYDRSIRVHALFAECATRVSMQPISLLACSYLQ
jgi:hypothetical protein